MSRARDQRKKEAKKAEKEIMANATSLNGRRMQRAWGMTAQQVDDFYARWREWVVVASHRGAVIVAHSSHEGIFKDLYERLLEDPWWTVRAMTPSPMLFKPEVPEGDMFFWTEEGGVQTPNQFLGNKGFGRLKMKAPTREGVEPWRAPEGWTPDDAPTPDGAEHE